LETTTINLEALLAVPSVSYFDVSPDGRKIVFSSNKSGQIQLYLGTLTDQGLEDCVQITSDNESKIEPRFFPDSKKIMYSSDLSGDERFNLYSLDLSTMEFSSLTKNKPREVSIYPNAMISKDGKKIAYVANHQKQFAAYVLDLEANHTSRISYHKFSDQHATISPDSKLIAYSCNTKEQETGIFISSLENPSLGETRLQEEGFDIDADEPAWSPDGKKIAFVSASKGMNDIGLYSIETRDLKWLTKSERECYEPIFSNDGMKLAFTVNTGADVKLVIYDLESNESSVLEFRHGVVGLPKFAFDDNSIFFQFTGPRNPPDVFQYRFGDEKFLQITNSLPEDVEVSNFVEGEQVFYESGKDKMRIPALIYMPNRSATARLEKRATKRARGKDTRENLPAIVEIHGGPTSQALNTWSPLVQALVARGFVVFRPNYRGSSGFGRTFREANRFVMGEMDVEDIMSGLNFLVKRNLADPNRIGVAGGSFGGYLTMCCLTKYPEAWSCGSALVPFLNWFTEIKNEREELRYWDLQNVGDPKKDEERLRKASPIFSIDKIKSPILLIAGANDPRCPVEETEQARDELQKLGRHVELKIYHDEGHGFRKTENRVEAYKKIIDFLEKNTPIKRNRLVERRV
jgi:dipeptidyl aminopeptidase/acylaminoacyl peptidase